MSQQHVNVDNFCRVETDTLFAMMAKNTGGVGKIENIRVPLPLDERTVIRPNRDTLYSGVVVDISQGGTLTVPDAGKRYLSVMVVNRDHYVNRVFHRGGRYDLSVAEFDTPYVTLAMRILVDPNDPDDVAEVNRLQDAFAVETAASCPFELPPYDQTSYEATRRPLLELARGLPDFRHAFGKRGEVDPMRHLIGTAAAWGGLPDSEAIYLNVDPGLPVGEYRIEVGDVPVDAFWSISLYDKKGFFAPNKRNSNNVNSVTAERNPDGTITVNFGNSDAPKPNYLPIMEGWNYMVRLYRPRPEILDGRWSFPELQEA